MKARLSNTAHVKPIFCGTTSPVTANSVSMTILGTLVSMKNRKIQSMKSNRAYSFKNPAVVRYEQQFHLQVPMECRNLRLGSPTVPLRAVIAVFYPNRRSDLDTALIYDCLQTAGVIANDRYVIERHEYLEVDAANPRAEIVIEEI